MPAMLVIVDVEATCCDEGTISRDEMEIIEIGAVAIDSTSGDEMGLFQEFIQPVRHPLLTCFCMNLTSIQQSDVATAPSFPEVISRLRKWLAGLGTDYSFCSWGDYDRRQFEQDCAYHRIPFPFAEPHRNLKLELSTAIGSKKKLGLGDALRRLGLDFHGTPHRGIDDARNIARIYQSLLSNDYS